MIRRAAPSFEDVENYVVNGLPEGHWSRDMRENDEYDDSNSDDSDKPIRKIWYDTDEYEGFSAEVLYSARFMDGLTADPDVYKYATFVDDFPGGSSSKPLTEPISWNEKFFFHAKVVVEYYKKEGMGFGSGGGFECPPHLKCDLNSNTHNTGRILTKSGHIATVCNETVEQFAFLRYCSSKIEGYQSQKLMVRRIMKGLCCMYVYEAFLCSIVVIFLIEWCIRKP